VINKLKLTLLVSALLTTTSIFAQTEVPATEKKVPAYGDNPNIFVVLGHKAKDGIDSTAVKIDNAAQKGIEKTKPKINQAVENTKDFAEETTEKAANGVSRTYNKAKEGVFGDPKAKTPIEQYELSKPSTPNTTTSVTTTPVQNIEPAQHIDVTPANTQPTDDNASLPR
jgi:hypothetical protein